HHHRPRLRLHAGNTGRRGGPGPGGHQSGRFAGRGTTGECRFPKPGRQSVMKWLNLAAGVAASALVAVLPVGPNYQRPPVRAPAAYKTEGPWLVTAPKDSLPKGAWWEIFNDAE